MIDRPAFRHTCLLFASCLTVSLSSSLAAAQEQATQPSLPTSPQEVHPILVGTRAPDGPLITTESTPLELAAALRDGSVLMEVMARSALSPLSSATEAREHLATAVDLAERYELVLIVESCREQLAALEP